MSDIIGCPFCHELIDNTFTLSECPKCKASFAGVSIDEPTEAEPEPPSPLNWIGVFIPLLFSFPYELLFGAVSGPYLFGRALGAAILFVVPSLATLVVRRTRFAWIWGLSFALVWLLTILVLVGLILMVVLIWM